MVCAQEPEPASVLQGGFGRSQLTKAINLLYRKGRSVNFLGKDKKLNILT